ncbi:Cilia and flagella-associated protein 61, partial [Taenia solium]
MHHRERGLFSLTAVGASGEVVGCLILNDTPPISLVKGIYGSNWLKTTFKFEYLNALNTMFVQLIVIKEEYKKRGFVDIIRAAFRALADVNHFLLLVPETANYDEFDESLPDNILRMKFAHFISPEIKPVFSRLLSTEEEKCELKWDVIHFMRRDFDSALHCRLASVKDNDDLTPIFNSKSDILRKLYGEFYISELVEAQNKNMKAIVLESAKTGHAVGFMNATTLYDAEFLKREYDLRSCNYLQKYESQEASNITRTASLLRLQTDLPVADVDLTEFDDLTDVSTEKSKKSHTDASSMAFREEIDPHSDGNPTTLSTDDLRSTILSDSFSVDKDTRMAYVSSGNWIRRHLRGYFGFNSPPDTQQNVYSCDDNNAFVIQLYGLLPEFDTRAKDFLPFMFDQFPGIDYAAITVPRLDPETTLLQEFYRVKPRAISAVTQDLYVYHRANLISDFQVRPAVRVDVPGILELAHQMHPFDRKLLTKDVKNYMKLGCESDGTALFCYVALCLGKIVGAFFARAEKHIDWLKANYDLEDYIYFAQHGRHEFATVIHFVLSLAVHSRARFFLREVMRQSGKTCFFYFIYPPFAMDTKLKMNTPLSCLGDFYAVRPRRQIVYPSELVKGEKGPQNRILSCPLDDPPPAVYHISRNLTMEPKIVLNARIVVVGASSTSLAFLECLAFASHIRFNNLVLLSPHGIPGDTEASENHRVPLFFPARNRKVIIIDGTHEMPYDFLILSPGLQYHPPTPIGLDPKFIAERHRKNPCEPIMISTKHKATNLFLLNDEHSTIEAIEYVEKNLMPDTSNERQLSRKQSLQTDMLLEDPSSEKKPKHRPEEGPIIIFGDCLDAYACVHGLLHMGVPSIRIIMMHPFKKNDADDIDEQSQTKAKPQCHSLTSTFDDYEVDTVIHDEMKNAGVRIFKRCVFLRWNDDPTAIFVEEIENATFIIQGLEKRIRCVAFFSFVDRKIDYTFFKAVNDACLVFDKQLVIDANFHTSDPCIRAAGPATKFHRICYNDVYTHALFNSLEVGKKLGDAFLKEFDPSVKMPKTPGKDELHLLPAFKMPRIAYALLPGGYAFLKIWEPGYKKNSLLRLQDPDFGRPLVTGMAERETGYFRIQINDINRISCIICLSRRARIPPCFNSECLAFNTIEVI